MKTDKPIEPTATAHHDKPAAGASVCAKRGWVLDVLTHEDSSGIAGSLPTGLKFHLGRCQECRELAHRLIDTSLLITAIAGEEPDATLQDKADSLALAALRSGRPAGIVVETEEQLDELLIDGTALRKRRFALVRRGLATAAVIAFAVLFGQAWQTVRRDNSESLAARGGRSAVSDMASPESSSSPKDASVTDEYHQVAIDSLTRPASPRPAEHGSVLGDGVPPQPDPAASSVGHAHHPKDH